MNKWLVVYSIPSNDHAELIIWANKREEVKPILKRHCGRTPFTIKSIKLWEAES